MRLVGVREVTEGSPVLLLCVLCKKDAFGRGAVTRFTMLDPA